MKKEVVKYFKSLQNTICKGLEQLDGSVKFKEDLWQREWGGGGRTRVIQNGNVFEKGGVNFSEVWASHPQPFPLEGEQDQNFEKYFYATGVSLVIHPHSPMVPIIHMNVRYLCLTPYPPPFPSSPPPIKKEKGQREGAEHWFGGGIDLTPVYIDEDDAKYFHQTLKATCDRFHPSFYPQFKKWADDYFFIPHRNEIRGIGGIFFDYIGREPQTMKIPMGHFFEFVMAVGNIFLPVYTHLVQKNKNTPFGEKEKQWQLLRRGRYAEFNLIYDRGTKFGLETNGRTESILMSLPPSAKWIYDFVPEKNSKEEKTLLLLKKKIDWAK